MGVSPGPDSGWGGGRGRSALPWTGPAVPRGRSAPLPARRPVPVPVQVPEMLRSRCRYRRCSSLGVGTGDAPLPVQVPAMLLPRCRYRRSSASSAATGDAPVSVGAKAQRGRTEAGAGKDPCVCPPPRTRAALGLPWCLMIGKANPKWGASRGGGHGLVPRASPLLHPPGTAPAPPSLPRRGRTESGPGLGELLLGPRGAAYMHLIARGRGN